MIPPFAEPDMSDLPTFLATAATVADPETPGSADPETGKACRIAAVDPASLVFAWRASDIIGARVHDDAGVEIGIVKDLLVGTGDTGPVALLATRADPATQSRNVVVSAADLEMVGDRLTLPAGSIAALLALPVF